MITLRINLKAILVALGLLTLLNAHAPKPLEPNNLQPKTETDINWGYMYQAICKVESNYNAKAVNSVTGASGILQIMPVGKGGYADEYIRLTKDSTLVDADLMCPAKSRKIFDKVQSIRNPNKDIDLAIKLHNPRGGNLYRFEVLMNFWKIKYEQQ